VKAAAFDYAAPADLAALGAALSSGEARIMAGGQSLGPMLNLRVAQPPNIVSIGRIAELRGVAETADAVIIGAAVTHAEIADGLVPDIGHNVLASIAEGIAYRAIRNRGTIGGSLCHADPAADWVTTLTALGATVLTLRPGDNGRSGGRAVGMARFVTGAFRTALLPDEIVQAIRIPRLSAAARWGYVKACRKPGEFAHAMAATLDDPDRDIRNAVIGAVGGPPILLSGPQTEPDAARQILQAVATGLDRVQLHMQIVTLRRAWRMAGR
jgi:carbon-monoxide dehydrogenase medium subunit